MRCIVPLFPKKNFEKSDVCYIIFSFIIFIRWNNIASVSKIHMWVDKTLHRKDWATRTTLKTDYEIMCSERANSSFFISGAHRIRGAINNNWVVSDERGKKPNVSLSQTWCFVPRSMWMKSLFMDIYIWIYHIENLPLRIAYI